jgi:hypothetical protein
VIAQARGLPPKPDDGKEGDVPPTCHWTLDRRQGELAKEGLRIKRSQIRRLLKAEHMAWQKPRTWLESTDPNFAEKGAIVGLYSQSPAGSTVICLDKLGPVAARHYPGPSWNDATHRPHFRPAYARYGYRRAFGALAHRTGAVLVETATTRNTAAWLHFLDGLEAFAPPGDAYLIVDALPLQPRHDAVELGASPLPLRTLAQGLGLAQSDRGLLEDPGPASPRRSRLLQHAGGGQRPARRRR